MEEPDGSEGAVGGTPLPAASDEMITDVNPANTINNQQHGGHNSTKKQFDDILYTFSDAPPNRVYVELADKKKPDAKINKYALGATIRKMQGLRGHIIDMKYVGRFKIIVLLNNFLKANLLVQKMNAEDNYYQAYIPAHLVTVTGKITGVPTHITEKDIEDDLESEVPVLQARRLHRYIDGKKLPTSAISVTFRASQLPEKVRLFSCVTRVLPFIKKVTLCEKCLRYGHLTNNCNGARRCQQCGNRHEDEAEYKACQKPIRCANCRTEGHNSTDPKCPERKRQANINAVRAKTNLTYTEAREQCPIACSNGYDMLSNFQDYPSLSETYSTTIKSKESFKQQWDKTNLPREPITPAVKWWKPDAKAKDKQKGNKRNRSSDPDSGSDQEAQEKAKKKAEETSANGVGLNNPHRVLEIERVQGLIQQATEKAIESANRAFQEQVMKFFSMVIDKDLPNEVQETFKEISKECFDLKKTIV